MMTPPNSRSNDFASRYTIIIQTITVVAFFIGGFWAGVIAPVQDRLTRVEKHYLQISEFEQFKSDAERRMKDNETDKLSWQVHNQFKEDTLNRISVMNNDITRIRTDQVTRSEHEQHWSDTKDRISSLFDEIASVRHDFSSSYTIADQMKSLQKQLDDLRLSIDGKVLLKQHSE